MAGNGPLVLEAGKVSKLYSRRPAATRRRLAGTFARALLRRAPAAAPVPAAGEFWALKDVSFTLRRGEALGIIGLNGAGKTTLLRMLAGQLLPDEGAIRVYGESAAMIDLTAGLQPAASGRQNVFLRGAMLGRSRKQMAAAFDEIVAFAELGEALDAPLATYSSGMKMRLAFAILLAAEPELLLIDEVLAVGDFRFRQKCLARIRELRERCAMVLVSHSMADIKRFCTRALVLHKGRAAFEGEPGDAVAFYESMEAEEQTPDKRREAILRPWHRNDEAVSGLEHYWCDAQGNPIEEITSGETLYFHAAFTLDHAPRHLIMGIPVWSEAGHYVTGFSTEVADVRFSVTAGARAVFRLEVPALAFNPGGYISNFTLLDGPEFLVRAENPPLAVRPAQRPFWGMVSLPHSWSALEEARPEAQASRWRRQA